MTFVTQAHYDRESHRDLTTEIIFTIAAAEDVDPVNFKVPPLYKCGYCRDRRRLLRAQG